MDGIRFLAVDSVFYLHGKSIEFWGGAEGIRDENALLSAIEAPRQSFVYGEVRDLFLLAATYAFHIAEAQAFRDGNKRPGSARPSFSSKATVSSSSPIPRIWIGFTTA